MDNPIEAIKRKIDIVDFIGSYIPLKKAGRNFKANCPFHQEKTPSFVISPERQIWHCFGSCGEGGDIFKFLMKWENITFFEALKELAQKTNTILKDISFEDKTWKKKEKYYLMNRLTAEFFHYLLKKTKFGKKGMDYLMNRKIKEGTIDKFMLGYSPDSWDSLRLFLKKKSFSDEEIYENGLVVKSEKGRYYDRFRGRLIFPLVDARDHILGFSGRSLDSSATEAKYVNTPETPIYHKRETLFGINLAKETIKKEKKVYLVEGEFDMITPYQNGFTNFVAIKGSAVTNEQLMLLKRYSEKLVLMLDADEAGEEAIRRGIEEAERFDFELSVVRLTVGKDPDEAIHKDINVFKKEIGKPVPVYDFLIDIAQKKYPPENAFNKKKIGDEIVPYLLRINNPIVKSHYIKKISILLEVSEESVESLMNRLKKKKKAQTDYRTSFKIQKGETRELILEKYLISLIFQSENPYKITDKIFAIIHPDDLLIPSHRKIMQIFLDKEKTLRDKYQVNSFASLLEPELKAIFDELYLYAAVEDREKDYDVERLSFEIKKYSLKRQLEKILEEKDDTVEKKERLVAITGNLKEVEKKLFSL